MKKTIIIVALLLTSLMANESYWQGTIGKSKIYLKIDCNLDKKSDEQNSCSFARYFYESQLQDIVIHNVERFINDAYKLQVVHNDKVVEKFLLKYRKGRLKGTWTSKGKSLKVVLKKLELNNKYNAFETCRTKFLKFKRKRVEKLKASKRELVWIDEVHSGISLFRLGNGFSSKVRNRLNSLLDKMQKEESSSTLSCVSDGYGSEDNYSEYQVVYISSDILTMSHSAGGYCYGNAHPSFGTSFDVFDLHTGKKYELEDIIVFAKNVPKHSKGYSEEWRHYQDTIRAKKLRELAFKSAGIELKASSSNEGGYDPYDLDHWDFTHWAYEAKGIEVFLHFCEANRCYRGDSYLIPFKLLKPYKNKSFPYEFGK